MVAKENMKKDFTAIGFEMCREEKLSKPHKNRMKEIIFFYF